MSDDDNENEQRQYRVLIGCNTSDEKRYEASTDDAPVFMNAADVDPKEIADFLEAGAIEEVK